MKGFEKYAIQDGIDPIRIWECQQIVNETSEQRFARQIIEWAHELGKLLRGE
jgi:hypothetical protein